jgi:hypothetical protein
LPAKPVPLEFKASQAGQQNQISRKPIGFVEADLVAHNGPVAKGSFVQTLALTDEPLGRRNARRFWCANSGCSSPCQVAGDYPVGIYRLRLDDAVAPQSGSVASMGVSARRAGLANFKNHPAERSAALPTVAISVGEKLSECQCR